MGCREALTERGTLCATAVRWPWLRGQGTQGTQGARAQSCRGGGAQGRLWLLERAKAAWRCLRQLVRWALVGHLHGAGVNFQSPCSSCLQVRDGFERHGTSSGRWDACSPEPSTHTKLAGTAQAFSLQPGMASGLAFSAMPGKIAHQAVHIADLRLTIPWQSSKCLSATRGTPMQACSTPSHGPPSVTCFRISVTC